MKEQKTILVHSATAHPNMEQVRQHQEEGWLVTHTNNTLNYVVYILEREKPVEIVEEETPLFEWFDYSESKPTEDGEYLLGFGGRNYRIGDFYTELGQFEVFDSNEYWADVDVESWAYIPEEGNNNEVSDV